MRGLLLLLLLPWAAPADSKWIQARSGPVEIYSDAPAKVALDKLGYFEQFRFALGTLVGKPELNADPPIRLLVERNPTEPSAIYKGRDRIAIPLNSEKPIPGSVIREAVKLLLDQNVPRLPAEIESGLETFFSTVDVKGAHVVWGEAPAAAERTKDWARVQMLATRPEYYGKLRILLFNLQKGIADDPAYRNAIGKSKKEFDAELDAYLKAGVFTPSDGPGRAFSAQRDVPVRPLDASDAQLAHADLLTARSREAYRQLIQEKKHIAEANEGLAILALRDKDEATALKHLTDATEGGTRSATAWLEYAKLETDRPKSNEALEAALELDPKLAEAHYMKGERRHDLEELKKATSLDPRHWEYWNALGDVYLDDNQFPEAARAYREAEQAAVNPADRERMHAAWSKIEAEKLDYQDSEKRRAADEQQRELQRLKDKAISDLHAAEARVNQRLGSTTPQQVVPWKDAGLPILLEGELRQVNCSGNITILEIQATGEPVTKLLLKNRGDLTCGPQKARRVSVEYNAKPDAKLGTSGELENLQQ